MGSSAHHWALHFNGDARSTAERRPSSQESSRRLTARRADPELIYQEHAPPTHTATAPTSKPPFELQPPPKTCRPLPYRRPYQASRHRNVSDAPSPCLRTFCLRRDSRTTWSTMTRPPLLYAPPATRTTRNTTIVPYAE